MVPSLISISKYGSQESGTLVVDDHRVGLGVLETGRHFTGGRFEFAMNIVVCAAQDYLRGPALASRRRASIVGYLFLVLRGSSKLLVSPSNSPAAISRLVYRPMIDGGGTHVRGVS